MKTLINSVVILVAAGIGLAVGFAFKGNHSRPASSSQSMASASPFVAQKKHSATPGAEVRPAKDDSPLATNLEQNLARSSGVNRWLHWLDALEKASPADFPRLARLARRNPAALRFLAARWVDLAPRH